jgi:hypothetical protein
MESEELPTFFWSMDFNGVVSKEGDVAGVWLHNHRSRYSESHSYKLIFQCTNNIVEYEYLISLLDGFSGHPEDQEKTTFTTPWGTFMYVKMPFGLMNVGATFQRAMDIAFVDELGRFIVIYPDDVTVYSQSNEEHLQHLRHVFEKCINSGFR